MLILDLGTKILEQDTGNSLILVKEDLVFLCSGPKAAKLLDSLCLPTIRGYEQSRRRENKDV
jgi:hypothetical protein